MTFQVVDVFMDVLKVSKPYPVDSRKLEIDMNDYQNITSEVVKKL
jgi:hypothetical protein